ncbi:hypothetical protein [Pedobacter sp. SG918]|uniref:hypothetical protein n=1 Tax=Pedobacter sp. SG918 TaxID=2587136 RepID=UPI00146D2BB0|nr:hypothetical protein [Pedobacter sp. SG918]NMN37731.1 putative CHY-type Zn-finger protein [Pedobacter sp. SG918]
MSNESFHQKWYSQAIIFPLLVTVIGSATYDAFKEKPFLTTLSLWLNWLWNGVVFILTVRIALYWFLALILLVIVIIAITSKSKQVLDPKQQYTTDTFISWQWEWSYDGRFVTSLTPLCPSCHTIMNYSNQGYDKFAECPRCNKTYVPQKRIHTDIAQFEDDKRIEMLIVDNIRKGNYKHF